MGLFSNFTSDNLEETQDRLGGAQILDTDIYAGVIKMAYAVSSQTAGSKAQGVFIEADFNGKSYKETFWVSDKEGKNYYTTKDKPDNKLGLPGFVMVDELCLVTTGEPLANQNVDEKSVKIYDHEAKKEIPKAVPVLVDLLGKEVIFAIRREKVDKTKKDDSTGKYEPTGETREQNVAAKVFHAETRMTVPEARAGKEAGEFIDAWVEKNKGQVFDRTDKSGNTGNAGAPPKSGAQQGSGAPRKSLFGNK